MIYREAIPGDVIERDDIVKVKSVSISSQGDLGRVFKVLRTDGDLVDGFYGGFSRASLELCMKAKSVILEGSLVQ